MPVQYQPLDTDSYGGGVSLNGNVHRSFNFDVSRVTFFIHNIMPSRSAIVGYLSGTLFTVGWWIFFDALILSKYKNYDVQIDIWDWFPGIISTLALIIINLINQESLRNDDFGDEYSSHAKLCAFIGVSLALGALGSSLTIFIMEYVIPGLDGSEKYCGAAIVIQNFLLFISSMTLWFGRNSESDNNDFF